MGHFLGGLSDQGIITKILDQGIITEILGFLGGLSEFLVSFVFYIQ